MTKREVDRFADLLPSGEGESTPVDEVGDADEPLTHTTVSEPSKRKVPATRSATPQESERRRPGRAGGGKRSRTGDDGDMIQTSIYLKKVTHRQVKSVLILDDKGDDLSELSERLLEG